MSVVTAKLPARAARFRIAYAATRIATVGDQVLVALTNFALTLAIGRAYGAEELASYGLGLSIGLMIQALQRHAITIPLMLEPDARVRRRRGGVLAAQWVTLTTALVIAGIAFAIATFTDAGRYPRLILAATAVCLVVYLQLEFARAFLVKLGRPWLLLASAAWYAGVSAVLVLAALTHRIDYETLLAVLGAAMVLHALGLAGAAGVPRLREGLRLLAADLRRYGGWAAVATATYAGYNHVPLLILGALLAPLHAAAFVATRSLMQPLQILLRGLDVADKSGFSQGAGAPRERAAFRFTLRLAVLYAAVAGVFGAAMAFFADRLIVLAYGAKFADAAPALVAWVPVYVVLSITMPLESLVYARRDFRAYYLVRGVASLVAIAATLPLVLRFAEAGAIAACGIGWLIAVAGTVILLKRGTP
jgi:O-antigen/teichoic acid export membrane protein